MRKERDLVKLIDKGDLLGANIAHVATSKLLTREEEQRIFNQKINGQLTPEAKDILVRANIKLVVKLAKLYSGHGVELIDLVQVGHLGLLRAMELYEPERGLKFSTYATPWVRQAVNRAVATDSRVVRIPESDHIKIITLFSRYPRLAQQLGREPDIQDYANLLGVNIDAVKQLLSQALIAISLDTQVNPKNKKSPTLLEQVEDTRISYNEETEEDRSQRQLIVDQLTLLPPRDQQVLKFVYGIPSGKPHSKTAACKRYHMDWLTLERIENQFRQKCLTAYSDF